MSLAMQQPNQPPPVPPTTPDGCAKTSTSAAIQQLEATCQLIAAGRIAANQLALHAKKSNLTETEFRLLWLLRSDTCRSSESKMIDQKTIGEMLGLSPAQISTVVERLRQANHIEGQPSPADRRRNVWQLTASSKTLLDASIANFAASPARLQVFPTLCQQEDVA